MRARVIDNKGNLQLVGDPAASGLQVGDEVEIAIADTSVRNRRKVRGLWKGTHLR